MSGITNKAQPLKIVIRVQTKSSLGAYVMIHHLLLFIVADGIRRHVSQFCQFTNTIHIYS
ncbi:hypothetical protein UUU_39240 [Klebsiella pneumoniae subsp. pneumoniae DSM 30104 = JCM 1662 = NBRC 14940]|nr:hypothetical protein UUU_39240 [Klebsiella pneumoniae subsp. pneumoniae DSM 30104 = JCM 1662 = NBRC 14940]